MNDADLAQRLESTWRQYFAAQATYSGPPLQLSMRGVIRHPAAYPLISFFAIGIGWIFSFSPAFPLVLLRSLNVRERALLDMHLAQCEIADLTDELKRRLVRASARAHPDPRGG